MSTKIIRYDGIPTAYGFSCGYQKTYEKDCLNRVRIYGENMEIALYSIQGHFKGCHFWIQFEGNTLARKMFAKVKSIIKKGTENGLDEIRKLERDYLNY